MISFLFSRVFLCIIFSLIFLSISLDWFCCQLWSRKVFFVFFTIMCFFHNPNDNSSKKILILFFGGHIFVSKCLQSVMVPIQITSELSTSCFFFKLFAARLLVSKLLSYFRKQNNYCNCSDFRNESNGIFVLRWVFFLQTNFDFLTSNFWRNFFINQKALLSWAKNWKNISPVIIIRKTLLNIKQYNVKIKIMWWCKKAYLNPTWIDFLVQSNHNPGVTEPKKSCTWIIKS